MFVYLVTNKFNGKHYIGQTTGTPEKRWQGHIRESRRPLRWISPFYSAIRKYGSLAFCISVLDTANSQDELNQKEIDFIAAYNTMDRAFGYNRHEGGNAPPRPSREAYARMADKRRGKKIIGTALENMRAAAKSESRNAKMSASQMGHPTSTETRAKIGVAHLGMKFSPEVIERLRQAGRISGHIGARASVASGHIRKLGLEAVKSGRLEFGRHVRWCVRRNRVNPNCPVCNGTSRIKHVALTHEQKRTRNREYKRKRCLSKGNS